MALSRTGRTAGILAAAVVAVGLSLFPAPAAAQVGAADPTQGVFVRESTIAADKFNLGQRMERLQEWHKSADVYQEILEEYQERVLPVRYNERGHIIKYSSVTVAVQERLARWPDEGLQVYRNRFEPMARTLLEGAARDELPTLHRILDLYFVTETALESGIRLMDLYLQGGDFAAAAWIGDRLLDWHPSLTLQRPAVLFRTATAHHLSGNPDQAQRRLMELQNRHGNAMGRVGGRDVRLGEALAEQLAAAPPASAVASGDSVTTFNVDAARSGISVASGRPGALIYSIDLPLDVEAGNDQLRALMQSRREEARDIVVPVVDRGQLFFQDGRRIYALHLESGAPLAGWMQSHGGSRMGQFVLPGQAPLAGAANIRDPRIQHVLRSARQHTLTLADDALLAVMGEPTSPMRGGAVGSGTQLVSLDRETGRLRWTTSPADLPANAGDTSMLNFSGAPLVVGDSVFVIARGGGGAGTEECHVVSIDLHTGQPRWSSYIASAQVGQMARFGGVQPPTFETISHLAFASGRIFVTTNLGAVAAVDAYSGATSWLAIYPRDERALGRVDRHGRPLHGALMEESWPWEFNPAIVHDGKVFALPVDGRYLMIYDAGTGDEIRRIDRELPAARDAGRLSMLLAVVGQRAYVASQGNVWSIDWTAQPNDRRPEMPGINWRSVLSGPIIGRPFVTMQRHDDPEVEGGRRLSPTLFVSTRAAVHIIDDHTGRVEERFPRHGESWGGPGNVLVTNDQVIIATPNSVNVYSDLEKLRERYRLALQENPQAVEPRITFAELMFNAGRLDESRTAFDEAIEILGGLDNLPRGLVRDRIFSAAMIFAQRLSEGAAGEATRREAVAYFFSVAAAAADDPSQHVSYRLSQARYIEGLPRNLREADLFTAVRLYQEILLDAEMRLTSVGGEEDGAVQAGRLAEKAIDTLISRAGRGLYNDYEEQARTIIDSLRGGADAGSLLELASSYPNSTVATEAMLLAATIYEEAGQPLMAGHTLRQIAFGQSHRFNEQQRLSLAEAMARNYLRVDNPAAALGRLQRAHNRRVGGELQQPLLTTDGQPLLHTDGEPVRTFPHAIAALERMLREQPERVADVRLPTRHHRARGPDGVRLPAMTQTEATVANIRGILSPPADAAGGDRFDRVIVRTAAGIACFQPDAAESAWRSNAVGAEAQGIYWLDANVLTWDNRTIALLEGDTGRTLWSGALGDLPRVDVAARTVATRAPAVAAPDETREHALIRAQLIVGGAPELVAMELPDRPAANAGGPQVESILQVRPLLDRIIVSTSGGRLVALDRNSGGLLWQVRFGYGPAIQQMLATDDFTVVRLNESGGPQIIALDSFSAQQVWRRTFPQQANTIPLNAALAANGMLVWTTHNAIAGKDLFDGGEEPSNWETPGDNHANMTEPHHLAVHHQEVLALTNAGRTVVRRQLTTGSIIGHPLNGTADPSTRLKLVGSRLYVANTRSILSYHLQHNTTYPPTTMDQGMVGLPQGTMASSDHMLLPIQMTGEERPTYAIQAISREMLRSDTGQWNESGLLEHQFEVSETSPITQWHAVEGGVYYLTQDGRLQFLSGNRPGGEGR